MAEVIDDIFKYLTILLLMINFILFTKSHKYYKHLMAFSTIYLYIIFSISLSTITHILFANKINNLYLSHFYFIFQFSLLSIFYINLLKGNKQRKLVRILFVSVITVLGIQYALDWNALFRFSLLEILLTSFPLILYSIIHLYNSLTQKGKYLYINAAILIYLTATTFIFILGNYLNGINPNLGKNIWFIHKLLYIVFLTLTLLEWKSSFSPSKIKVMS